ncbi:MAG: S1/P1 nuclease [Paludibacteraceae bacterium]|nr:S1/P1 nuclease [Paludibacteraceae bacterium]
MKKALLSIIGLCLTMQLMAWDAVAHRIVAEIAYRRLNKKAVAQVDKLLGKRGMVYTSSWADEIKSDTIYPNSYDWHFQNLNPGMTRADIDALYADKLKEGEHLFYAKDSLVKVLRLGKATPDELADALKFVVHLSGDEFQPMHMGHADDKGGNRVLLTWFRERINLHSLWDSFLVAFPKYSYTEYVDFLMDTYGPQEEKVASKTELECLYDTYEAVNYVYQYQAEKLTPEPPRHYEYRYHYDMKEMMNYQLYAAGIQLAKLLNEIYR